MAYCNPPLETRFSATNPPKNPGRHKGSTLTDILRTLLKKKITFEDPETKQMVKGKISQVVMLRLLLNATQGENEAIKEILDRIDGKTAQKIIGEGFAHTVFIENIVAKSIPNRISQYADPG